MIQLCLQDRKPFRSLLRFAFAAIARSTDHPKGASADQKTVYDNRFLQELETSGFVNELCGGK